MLMQRGGALFSQNVTRSLLATRGPRKAGETELSVDAENGRKSDSGGCDICLLVPEDLSGQRL
ncbi:hypothetical protein PG996_004483 [Apiospora saccharicola]|uniref:Uncharacterized protein n=1 Tax=Apiospora saccharicola TaxID=335842 RepID=A0ABR1W479_9PEZI